MSADPTILKRELLGAFNDAQANWDCWENSILHCGEWSDFPLVKSLPEFLGFGFDYSVFRGYQRHEIVSIFEFLERIEAPDTFANFYRKFAKMNAQLSKARKQDSSQRMVNRISLVSKLLALWSPQEFAMWDTYARRGLFRLRGSIRGTSYYRNDVKTYDRFNTDFFDSFESAKKLIAEPALSPYPDGTQELFAIRLFDTALMKIGK